MWALIMQIRWVEAGGWAELSVKLQELTCGRRKKGDDNREKWTTPGNHGYTPVWPCDPEGEQSRDEKSMNGE